jgi:hypothetical protein
MDELDMDALKRLTRSIQRFLGEEPTLSDGKTHDLKFLSSRPMGGAWLLNGLWKRIGSDKLLEKRLKNREFRTGNELS